MVSISHWGMFPVEIPSWYSGHEWLESAQQRVENIDSRCVLAGNALFHHLKRPRPSSTGGWIKI
jgi:hypothetical protein